MNNIQQLTSTAKQEKSLQEILREEHLDKVASFLNTHPDFNVSRTVFSNVLYRRNTPEVIGVNNWEILAKAYNVDVSVLQKYCLPSMGFKSIKETPAYQLLSAELGFVYRGDASERTFNSYCKEKLGSDKSRFVDLILRGFWDIASRPSYSKFALEVYITLAKGTSISYEDFFPEYYWNRECLLPLLPWERTITNVAEDQFEVETFGQFDEVDRSDYIVYLLNTAEPSLTEKQRQVLERRLQGYTTNEIAELNGVSTTAIQLTEKGALKKFPNEMSDIIRYAITDQQTSSNIKKRWKKVDESAP